MVSLVGLSPSFQKLLRDHFAFLDDPSCLSSCCPARYLDFLEVYSGRGNLSAAVERVACFFTQSFQVQVIAFCPTTIIICGTVLMNFPTH